VAGHLVAVAVEMQDGVRAELTAAVITAGLRGDWRR